MMMTTSTTAQEAGWSWLALEGVQTNSRLWCCTLPLQLFGGRCAGPPSYTLLAMVEDAQDLSRKNPWEAAVLYLHPTIQPSQAFPLVWEWGGQPCILPILFPQSIPVQMQLLICGDFRCSLPHHFIYSSPPPGIRLLLQPSKVLLEIPVYSLQVIRFYCRW
jgi:hypothetical protein